MQKYYFLLKYEFKNLLRDKMNLTMFVYPIIMLIMSVFLFPMLFNIEGMNTEGLEITMVILIITLVSFGYMIAAILLGFSLLDNKDEDTMQTIAVTPISKKGYVNFKLIYTYIISIFATILMLGGTKLLASGAYVIEYGVETLYIFNNVSYLNIVLFAISSSLFVPAMGLFIVALAKNKVEGFAYMKSSGFLMLIPMLTLFDSFRGVGQYILSIFPNFWGAKAMLNLMFPQLFFSGANLSFSLCLIVVSILCILFSYLGYRFYMKRTI